MAISAVFSFRLIRYSRIPPICTSLTPDTFLKSGVAISGRIFEISVLSPLSAATLRTTTGIVPKPPLSTLAEAFAGRLAFTESRALLSESVTLAVLVPKSKVTRTVEIEDWLVEAVVVTPSRF